MHLLPFMDELALYQDFKLNEPWDSPHNIKLLPRMPKVYAAPGIKTRDPFTTHYLAITGPGTAFDPTRKAFPPMGAAVAEVPVPVPWTKPAEVVYDAKLPIPKLGGVVPRGFHAGFVGGFVRFIQEPINENSLRSILTGNGQIREPFRGTEF